jgi:hypothetical protein
MHKNGSGMSFRQLTMQKKDQEIVMRVKKVSIANKEFFQPFLNKVKSVIDFRYAERKL